MSIDFIEYPLTELIQPPFIDFIRTFLLFERFFSFKLSDRALADEILGFLLAALVIGRLGMRSLASEREFSMRRLGWPDRSRREQG